MRNINNTEHISLRVIQIDEVLPSLRLPHMPRGTEREEPLDLLRLPIRVQIEMQPILPDPRLRHRLQRHVHPAPARVAKHHPTLLRLVTRHIPERRPPELQHPRKSLQSMTTDPISTDAPP